MPEFVQLWVYLSSTPLFGLTATLVVYVARAAVYDRLRPRALGQPGALVGDRPRRVLLATARRTRPISPARSSSMCCSGPAVVALAWPLWQRRAELRRRSVALLAAALVGGGAAGGSAVLLASLLGLPGEVVRSLAPKSVTAPVAMGIAERIGGVPALAAVFAVLTGLVGALSAKYLFDGLGIAGWAVRGFALGTASHGIGAARAMQVHDDAGAYAGIALGLQVLLASLMMPLLFRWLA